MDTSQSPSPSIRKAICLSATCLLILGGLSAWSAAADARLAQPSLASTDPSFFSDLLKVYTPRQQCMQGERPVVWLHVASDSLIAAAYYSIPVALISFTRRRRDLVFGWMFWLFALFILACGTTHLFSALDIWRPYYRVEGIVKALTAALSIGTAIALWPLLPSALALPSPDALEQTVRVRTAELARSNTALQTEMSARAEAETVHARLAAIVQCSDDAIVSKTLDGIITSWNNGAERIFGYTADEIVGKSILTIIPPERAHEEPQILARLRRGELIDHFETVRCTKDGRRIDVSVTISPIRDRSGRLVGASKIARDITDRKRAEAERERLLESERVARAEAERVSRVKDEFLATLSHELRTPLNAIVGWSQVLLRKQGDPDVHEGIEVISRNARLQAQLIDDLLDMSRIISGKLRLNVEVLDASRILESSLQTVAPAVSAKRIDLVRRIEPGPSPVAGDPARLQQIFWNLLSNAVKFTPAGGRIEVSLRRADAQLEVEVKDSGIGIRPQFLPHLFQRFSQADSTTTRMHGGLGLGLSIVRHLVELHGGTVAAFSEGEGKGATFTVRLPLRLPREGRADGLSAHAPHRGSAPRPLLEGFKILAVDDEPDARSLVKRVLEDAGARVVTASSAEEAMQVLTRERPDLLLCDIGLPHEDGYSLIRRIRRLPPAEGGDTYALALTAFARPEDREHALMTGFQGHIAKPAEPSELVAVVASAVYDRRPVQRSETEKPRTQGPAGA